tara:strand:+ start:320 stop:901 length:582 start_codon:yes stop_codon:yes gene_type:complete
MPIIKDKYKSKGDNIRSTYVNRKENRSIQESAPTGLTNQQRDQLAADDFRKRSKESSRTGATTEAPLIDNVVTSKVAGYVINEASKVQKLFTLQNESTLNNVIIQNVHTSTANISLYWSHGDQSNASFTVSSDSATAQNVTIHKLFMDSFTTNATISLADLVNTTFRNVTSEVHFYALSSVAGVNITVSITDA